MTAAVSQRDPDPVPFRELVAAEVRAQLARRSMSGRTLARQIHRDQTWVSRRLKAATPMTTDDLELISSALGMTALQLIAAIPPGAAVSGSSGPTGSPTRE